MKRTDKLLLKAIHRAGGDTKQAELSKLDKILAVINGIMTQKEGEPAPSLEELYSGITDRESQIEKLQSYLPAYLREQIGEDEKKLTLFLNNAEESYLLLTGTNGA